MAVREAKPDVVIFTGDSINSEAGVEVFRRTMRQLHAPLGRYAVKGNHDVWYWSAVDLFGGGTPVELDARTPLNVGPLQLCGARYEGPAVLEDCLRAAGPPGSVSRWPHPRRAGPRAVLRLGHHPRARRQEVQDGPLRGSGHDALRQPRHRLRARRAAGQVPRAARAHVDRAVAAALKLEEKIDQPSAKARVLGVVAEVG